MAKHAIPTLGVNLPDVGPFTLNELENGDNIRSIQEWIVENDSATNRQHAVGFALAATAVLCEENSCAEFLREILATREPCGRAYFKPAVKPRAGRTAEQKAETEFPFAELRKMIRKEVKKALKG